MTWKIYSIKYTIQDNSLRRIELTDTVNQKQLKTHKTTVYFNIVKSCHTKCPVFRDTIYNFQVSSIGALQVTLGL